MCPAPVRKTGVRHRTQQSNTPTPASILHHAIPNSPRPPCGPTSGMNSRFGQSERRPVSLSVADANILLVENVRQNEKISARGIWRGDPIGPFRNGQVVRHIEISTNFNALRTGPVVRMTPAPNRFIRNSVFPHNPGSTPAYWHTS